jgi:hypothetical protein
VPSQKVLPHIVLAQAAMPHLKDTPSSSYMFVTGRMGEDCLKTDEALLCISNAAIYGISCALRAESAEVHVAARVAELRIGSVIRRDDAGENPAFPGWRAQPASALASVIADAMLNADGGQVLRISEEMIATAPRERRREAPLFEAGGVEASTETRQLAGAAPVKLVAVPAVLQHEAPGHYGSERYASERGGSYAARGDVASGREARYEREEPREREAEGITGKVGAAIERGMERVGLTSAHKEA